MLVDVHAHLDNKKFENKINEVINRAKEKEVRVIVNNGIDVKSNRETLKLSFEFKTIFPSLGLYPWDAIKLSKEEIKNELNFIKNQKIISLGEIGLDYFHGQNPLDIKKQKEVFVSFLDLAKEMKKPVIVHSRKAEKDVLKILSKYDLKVVLHCFSGDIELAKEGVGKGYFFSIPPIIVKSERFQKLAEFLPIDNILTETDSPYLSSRQGQVNEPAFVVEALEKISKIKNLKPKEVEEKIWSNFKKVF